MKTKRPPRLLIADDQVEMRNNMSRILRLEGFDVVATSNGRRALDMLAADGPFDLLLLDINMPDIDGFSVLEKLRAVPETFHLPVILVTGEIDTNAVARGKRLGATAYLTKPYKISDLLDCIRAGLAGFSGEPHPEL